MLLCVLSNTENSLKKEIFSFETFAKAKENSLTAQSDTLAGEMKKLEEELSEKLQNLENELEAKQDEEKKLRVELDIRKKNPRGKVSIGNVSARFNQTFKTFSYMKT